MDPRPANRQALLPWALGEQDSDSGVEAMGRIFVLNRFVFDVPSRVPLGEVPLFGGWDGVLADADTLDVLWPWRVVKGTKRLTGVFMGYLGDRYRGLREFDCFNARFGGKRST